MLLAISNFLGVPLDQLTFFVSQLVAILCSYLLKKCLPPQKKFTTWRHLTEITAIAAYLMMIFLPPNIAQYAVLLFTMTFLSWAHIQRLFAIDDARQQSVDITAPLMIQTQKLSSVAFNFYDGAILSSGKELSKESHKAHAIKSRPKLLPFFGYLMCFQNSMVGPFLFYSDYLFFIEGREEDQVSDSTEREYVINHKDKIRYPKGALKTQFITFLFHFFLAFYATGRYEPAYLISDEFQRLGIFRKYFWLTLYGFYLRQKFYCAWTISSLAMLVSGFGFSGFSLSSNGALEPEYRNAINVRFFGCEFGTNTKEMLDNWNIGTMRWLRECVYDRVPKRHAVMAVFFVSAFWHGFYPVYYLCFFSAALLTMTGRLCRARLRPCFVESYWYHRLYDILTNMGALFCLNYLGVAFSLLDTSMAFKFWGIQLSSNPLTEQVFCYAKQFLTNVRYLLTKTTGFRTSFALITRNFYFLGHIVPMIMLFLLPYILPSVKREPIQHKPVVGVSYELNLDPESRAPLVIATTSGDKDPSSGKSK